MQDHDLEVFCGFLQRHWLEMTRPHTLVLLFGMVVAERDEYLLAAALKGGWDECKGSAIYHRPNRIGAPKHQLEMIVLRHLNSPWL